MNVDALNALNALYARASDAWFSSSRTMAAALDEGMGRQNWGWAIDYAAAGNRAMAVRCLARAAEMAARRPDGGRWEREALELVRA